MKNYVVKKDKKWYVLETQTDQVIQTFGSKAQAYRLARHLNLGGGFDGVTPKYFLAAVQDYINKCNQCMLDYRGGGVSSGKCQSRQQEMIGLSSDLWGSANPSLINGKGPEWIFRAFFILSGEDENF